MFNDFSRFAESHAAVIADAVPVGIVITNSSGNLLFVNAELERMTGYERGELLGRPVDLLLSERFRAGHGSRREGYVAAPTQRDMGEGRELFARRRDGSKFPVEVGLRPIVELGTGFNIQVIAECGAEGILADPAGSRLRARPGL